MCRLPEPSSRSSSGSTRRSSTGPLQRLCRDGYAESEDGGAIVLTASGEESYERILEARRSGLRDLLDGLEPADHPELQQLVERLGRDLVREMPAPA